MLKLLKNVDNSDDAIDNMIMIYNKLLITKDFPISKTMLQ